MRILIGRLSGIVLASLALSACQSEECKNKSCGVEPSRPGDPLTVNLQVSPAYGWDSVFVELHSGGAVESGSLLRKWTLKGGETPLSVTVGEGEYSGKATYMRTGDTLDVYDADKASWDSNEDECGCVTGWSRNTGNLDLSGH